jgi:AAA family ATP:ADP antiporter
MTNGRNRIYKFLSRFIEIKPDEWTIAVLLFTFFFLITAPHTIIKALRYADLLKKFGSQGLPLAYLLAAVVTGLVVLLHSKIQHRIPNQILIISSLVFFIITGLLFQTFLDAGSSVLSYLYWVWASVLVVVLMTHFGLTINEVFNPREAKRLIGFCGSGGILGGVTGGLAASFLTRLRLGHFLLPLACGLLLVCIFVVRAIFAFQKKRRSLEATTTQKTEESQKVGFKDSFNVIQKNHYLVLIAMIVIITVIVSTFIDFQLGSVIEYEYTTKDEMQAFYGLFFGGLTTFAFFLQILLTGFLLKKTKGILLILLLTPIVLTMGSVGILIGGLSLLSAIVIKGSDESLAFSLNQSVKEILYIPVAIDLRNKARPFIDMFINRFAKVIAAILLFLAGILSNFIGTGQKEVPYMSPIMDPSLAEFLSWGVIIFIIIWIILNLRIYKEHVRIIDKKTVPLWARAEKTVGDKIDIDYTKLVIDTMESRSRSSVLYALHLFDLLEQDKLTSEIREMISEKVGEVKISSMGELFNAQGATWFPDMEDDTSQEGFITDIKEIMSLDAYQHLMKLHADKVMEEGAESESETEKMELAKAIGMMEPNALLVDKLETLIGDDSAEVARYAIESAVKLRKKEYIPCIIQKLSNPLVREDAVTALKKFGHTALHNLDTYLRDRKKDLDLRKAIVAVLAQIGTQEAVNLLLKELEKELEELDSDIIDALDRIRSERTEIHIPVKIAKRKTLELTKKYCETFVEMQYLRPDEKESTLENEHQKSLTTHFRDIFKMLGLFYPREVITKAYQNLETGTKNSVDYAIELLDHTLKKDVRNIILTLVEDTPPATRQRKFQQLLKKF